MEKKLNYDFLSFDSSFFVLNSFLDFFFSSIAFHFIYIKYGIYSLDCCFFILFLVIFSFNFVPHYFISFLSFFFQIYFIFF